MPLLASPVLLRRPAPAVAGFAAVLALGCMTIAAVTTWKVYPTGYGQAAAELPDNYLVQGLVRWDAGWYARISREGYDFTAGGQSPTAFFPGYPLVLAGLGALGMNAYSAGVLASLVFGLLGIFVFTRWASKMRGEEIGLEAGLMLALYPVAIYLYGIVYSDGLFLLLAATAFLLLEERKVFAAALVGALATATRPVAPAIVLGLLVRNWELERARGEPHGLRTALPLLAAAGMASYMAYLQLELGDALAFAHAQSAAGWDNAPGWRTWLKLEWFRVLSETTRPLIVLRLGGHALATLVGLALVVPTWKLLGRGYGLFCLIAIAMPAINSHDFQGLGRYLIAAFPLFLTATLLLRRRRWVQAAWLLGSGAALFMLAFAFGYGGYVA